MRTAEKSPERCALGCADTADVIPGEPCSSFWERCFSCCCRRVLQLRRSSPIRRHLIRTIYHLEKALPFKEKKSTVQTSPAQENATSQTQWDGATSDPGTWKFCLALLHLSIDSIAARPCERYGLQERASTKSGCSNGKEGKGTFRETTANWFSAEWTMPKCSNDRAKNTFADFPCHWFLPNSLILLALSADNWITSHHQPHGPKTGRWKTPAGPCLCPDTPGYNASYPQSTDRGRSAPKAKPHSSTCQQPT